MKGKGAKSAGARRPEAARRLAVATCAALAVVPIAAGAQTVTLAPFIAVVGTASDNVALVPDDAAKSGWISEIVPGLRAELKGARARGRIEYRLHDAHYSSDSRLDNRYHYLDARGTIEAVDKWLFLDAQADITQQNRSAFGTSSVPDRPTASGNQVETSVVKLSPHVRGEWGDIATYRLRYNYADVRTDDATLADTRITEWVGRVANAGAGGRLGWAVDGQVLEARNDVIDTADDRRIRGTVSFAVTPQLRVSLVEGYETQTFQSPEREGNDTPGAGIVWTPSERTRLAGVYERRFFGDGHSASFTHHTGRVAIRASSVRDATVLSGVGLGGGSPVQALLSDLVASAVVDPEARAAAARQRLEAFGLASYSSLGSAVLTPRPAVYRTSELSVALTYPRDLVTFTYLRRDQNTLGVLVAAADDNYRQRGGEVNWGHRLTPVTTLNVFANTQRTVGEGPAAAVTRQERYGVSLASRLGPHTTASVGVRHVKLDTSLPIGDYKENAAYASFEIRY